MGLSLEPKGSHSPPLVNGAVLGPEAFVLRFFGGKGDDRLLLVNFGRDPNRPSIPEPLMAPAEGAVGMVLWSSEEPAYDGCGTPLVETDAGWRIPGDAAIVMAAVKSVSCSSISIAVKDNPGMLAGIRVV